MKPKLNVRLLRRIQKHILAEPRRFYMRGFRQSGAPGQLLSIENGLVQETPPCRTMACIGGWACILSGRKTRTHFFSTAKELLGLSQAQAEAVFSRWGWPAKFMNRYNSAKNPLTRARIANERIEHLIQTRK